MSSRSVLFAFFTAAALGSSFLAGVAGPVTSAAAAALTTPTGDWTQYQYSTLHGSMSPETAFTTSNAASATQVWHFQPPAISGQQTPFLDASPTVVGGHVYIGAESGMFYALDAASGAVLWSRMLDTVPSVDCTGPGTRLGITSTAAVLPDPVTGASTVYVSGARFLYALDAATGAIIWQTEIGPPDPSAPNAYYNWSSPTVVAGHIYVGLSSGCDQPLIQGGVVELDQETGHVLNTFNTVPTGSIGGSVWSSVAASSDGQDIWVTTGNECSAPLETCPAGNQVGNSVSILHLSASLQLLQAWQVKHDFRHNRDFGSTPVIFGSGTSPEVGACNKNGVFYALAANPLGTSPLWQDTIANPRDCLPSGVWDGSANVLYISANATTIGGTSYGGSISAVNPQTGAFIWQTGLGCSVTGTPTLDSAGVLAVGTYFGCVSGAVEGVYLIDATTGAIIETLPGSSRTFAQPVFAEGGLYVATERHGLYDFAP
jgi:polyvinyl alcohol dehydrogenase (cytochrome)